MADKIRFGILGPGNIAHKFAQGVSILSDAKLLAVGSRSKERATQFASKYGIERAYGSYEELVADKDIDVIYVASLHPAHMKNALLCLNAGRAVLCEKAFTMNAVQAQRIINTAREKKLFLMEAMWTRFLPVTVKVREWLSQGVIGEVQMLRASFGFRVPWDENSRLLAPTLGGGALLDAGIYPVSYASMVFGAQPAKASSIADIGKTGVDEQFSTVFQYLGGSIASLSGAVRTALGNDAVITGTLGQIVIPNFLSAHSAELTITGSEPVKYEPVFESTGYNYEAAEVIRCLRTGKTESDIMPLDETLSIMKTMDAMRAEWGLKYPCEE